MSVSQEQKLQSNYTVQEVEPKQSIIQEMLSAKEYKALVQLLKKNKKSRLSYQKVKFQGTIYQIGQNLSIKSNTRHEYVAKLIKILNLVDEEDNCIPLIKVQWYIRKNELENVPKEQLECISENEVFKTNLIDYIEIDSIIGLATILSYEEYDSINDLNDHIYFTRASFINKSLSPPFSQWQKTCMCQKPPNPDLKYIFCEMCEQWCHIKCVDLTKEKAEKLNSFYCKKCQC